MQLRGAADGLEFERSLHEPNDGGRERAHLFEIDDLGDTLRVRRPFP